MGNYAAIIDPKSKGTKILIYDIKTDRFYTIPGSALKAPVLPHDVSITVGTLLLLVLSYPIGFLCDSFINSYIWNIYIYIGIVIVTIIFSWRVTQKYVWTISARILANPTVFLQKEETFVPRQDLQTVLQRKKYLSSINSKYIIIKMLWVLLIASIALASSIIKLTYTYNTNMLYLLLICVFVITMLLEMSVAFYNDSSRRYLWEKFGKKVK